MEEIGNQLAGLILECGKLEEVDISEIKLPVVVDGADEATVGQRVREAMNQLGWDLCRSVDKARAKMKRQARYFLEDVNVKLSSWYIESLEFLSESRINGSDLIEAIGEELLNQLEGLLEKARDVMDISEVESTIRGTGEVVEKVRKVSPLVFELLHGDVPVWEDVYEDHKAKNQALKEVSGKLIGLKKEWEKHNGPLSAWRLGQKRKQAETEEGPCKRFAAGDKNAPT